MPRSVNHVASRARRKKVLKQTRGYFGRRKNVWTVAKNAYEKALGYAYVGRKLKKRDFRSLWITRINAACRVEGLSYSQFMGKIHKAGINLNRKALADLALHNPSAFKAVVDAVKHIDNTGGKTATKAAPAKKVAPVKSTAPVVTTAPVAENDNYQKIEGIGPAIERLLHEAGLHTFEDLANASVERLEAILNAAGSRFTTHKPGTWPRQAALAAAGKWDELKAWQDELDGGKE